MPYELLDDLIGSIWHTTSSERLEQIYAAGAITPNPSIPDKHRWNTKGGPGRYPFVREIGGISLFDFRGFDANKYSEKFPLSGWRRFVPCVQYWDESYWIELSVDERSPEFLNGIELQKKQAEMSALSNILMPLIECAFIGDISIDSFRKVLYYDQSTRRHSLVKDRNPV